MSGRHFQWSELARRRTWSGAGVDTGVGKGRIALGGDASRKFEFTFAKDLPDIAKAG